MLSEDHEVILNASQYFRFRLVIFSVVTFESGKDLWDLSAPHAIAHASDIPLNLFVNMRGEEINVLLRTSEKNCRQELASSNMDSKRLTRTLDVVASIDHLLGGRSDGNINTRGVATLLTNVRVVSRQATKVVECQ